MAGRPNQQAEMRLVAEWVARTYPDATWRTRVRLGSLSPQLGLEVRDEAEARLVHGAFARWADAVVELEDRLLLIEAKLVAHPVAVAQLELYARLIPYTPDFISLAPKPVESVLLYAVEDPLVVQMARERGIRSVQYHPSWVDEYLESLHRRHRTAPLPQELVAT